MSGNHRLDDTKGERERVEAAGSNVSQSLLDGKPVGPMRVWPGGLAMSRSIGDHEVSITPPPEGGGKRIPVLLSVPHCFLTTPALQYHPALKSAAQCTCLNCNLQPLWECGHLIVHNLKNGA